MRQHPTVHGTTPNKEVSSPNTHSADPEKPQSEQGRMGKAHGWAVIPLGGPIQKGGEQKAKHLGVGMSPKGTSD